MPECELCSEAHFQKMIEHMGRSRAADALVRHKERAHQDENEWARTPEEDEYPKWFNRCEVENGLHFSPEQRMMLRLFAEHPYKMWPHPHVRSLRGRVCDLPADTLHLITNGVSE